MKKLKEIMFGSQSHKNEGINVTKRRGILFVILIMAFGLSFFSCDGQNPKPIKVDVTTKPNNNGVGLGVKKDTVFINVPYEVIKTVEVIKEVPVEVIVKVPEPYPVEVIKEVIKEVEKIVYQDKIVEVIKEVPYEVIKEVNVEKEKAATVDTLQTISDVILLDFTDSAVQPTNTAAVYAMIKGIGLSEIKMDTMYAWQRAYNLKRTQEYGKVSYESFGLPFQVREIVYSGTTENAIKITVKATEQCHIKLYLNNKLVTASSDTDTSPFSATKISNIEYRHGRTISELLPNTEYEVYAELVTQDGKKAFSEPLKFKTL